MHKIEVAYVKVPSFLFLRLTRASQQHLFSVVKSGAITSENIILMTADDLLQNLTLKYPAETIAMVDNFEIKMQFFQAYRLAHQRVLNITLAVTAPVFFFKIKQLKLSFFFPPSFYSNYKII